MTRGCVEVIAVASYKHDHIPIKHQDGLQILDNDWPPSTTLAHH